MCIRDRGNSGDIVLPISVDVAERLGGSTFLYGKCAGLDNFVVQRPGLELARSGDQLELSFNASVCYLFDESGAAFRRLSDNGRTEVA